MRRFWLAALPAVIAQDVSAGCNSTPVGFNFGYETTVSSVTDTGRCTHSVSSLTNTTLSPPSLVSAPRSGTLSFESLRVRYRANPGFSGSDSYAFKRCTGDGTSCATFRVTIAVTQTEQTARHPGAVRKKCAQDLRRRLSLAREDKLPLGSGATLDRCVPAGGPI